jgi:hypothetical protein
MSDSSFDLPEVEPRDPEPVAVAIETARALFRTGAGLDALRWLRRAAERAEESGDDARAVQLARSAADLSTALQSVPPPPPTSRRHDEAIALAPYDDFSDKTVVDAAAPVAREALHSSVQITEMPTSSQASPRSLTLPSQSASETTAIVSATLLAPTASVAKPALLPAVRVSLARDPAMPGAWRVRPLAEGSAIPTGCEEALLVALDPKSQLL